MNLKKSVAERFTPEKDNLTAKVVDSDFIFNKFESIIKESEI